MNRTCVMDPDPRCDEACVSGYVLGHGRVPPPPGHVLRRIAPAPVASASEGDGSTDAVCGTMCPSGQGLDPQSGACFTCGSGPSSTATCSGEGESRRVIIESGSSGRSCFCETTTGYFRNDDGRAEACDADDDGWISSNAVNAIENAQANVRLNARCDLRMIDRFELINEAGSSTEETLTVPLPLYERPQNDGADGSASLSYGGMVVAPNALNSLTKACESRLADFNGNGLGDVDEGQNDSTSVANSAYFDVYTRYSYFMELNDGYFIAGAGDAPGKYVVQERPRLGPADGQIRLGYDADPNPDSYFRHCSREDDNLATSGSSRAGLDFTCAGDTSCTRSMHHHSQFRCVVGVTSAVYNTGGGSGGFSAESEPGRAYPPSGGSDQLWWLEDGSNVALGEVNDCSMLGTTYTRTGFKNSTLLEYVCAGDSIASDDGDTAQWVVVNYFNADPDRDGPDRSAFVSALRARLYQRVSCLRA